MEHLTLYFKQGSSDKIYQASIEPQDGGYSVQFAYGRRGATLATGTKTQSPVPYDEARRIYEKLVAEKTAKGYTPGEDGTPYQHTDREQQVSGITAQLLNPIEPEEAARLIADPVWIMQEKFDGKRTLIRKGAQRVEGVNRRGLIVALPEPVGAGVSALPGTFILDGESVGDSYFAFDLLELGGADCRDLPYRDRLAALVQLVLGQDVLVCAETAAETAHKDEMLERLRRLNKEGAVFKKVTSPYRPGRPASGGDALKLKFCTSASFVVAKVNAKRSVSLQLHNGVSWVAAGNVTIPPNQDIPAVGWVIECRYLYALRESGKIYQPVYLGAREDIPAEECVVGQLKFKAEVTEIAAGARR